jgi:HlyD family secretion protein
MSMDRKIKKKKWPPKKIAGVALGAAFVLFVGYVFLFQMNKSTLNVEAERLTISTVERGPFQEYIPIMGNVMPIDTFHLDATEGGRVDKIFLQAGSMVKKGDPILELGNTNLLLDIMWREADFINQSNRLRETRLAMEQYLLRLTQDMAEVENQLSQQKMTYDRYLALAKDELISQHEFDLVKRQYEYLIEKKELMAESQKTELKFRQEQVRSLGEELTRMQENFNTAKQKLENLIIRAPISGQLTALDAEIGQVKSVGQRLGQIDVLDAYRVRAGIDEFYIARLEEGKTGEFDFANNTYTLRVSRVYPEVRDGKFEVDMLFVGPAPEGIRRGQTFHIRLELGDIAEAVLLARGGFFQTTGGNWVYLLDKSREVATRRTIRLGRQNPQFFEVLDGLQPGDQVVTSSYESFGDMERLVLK